MEKPSAVYHGSSNRHIDRFEPRSEKVRDPKEGPRVFATSDKRMASVFIVGADDSWANSGMHNGVPYIVISDRERFEKLDQGGAIYHLPSDAFQTDPNKGLREIEWTSSEPVEPYHKEEHESAVEAMLEHGVQVYFVDPETYEAWKTAPDHGLSILKWSVSENQKRNINPVSFEVEGQQQASTNEHQFEELGEGLISGNLGRKIFLDKILELDQSDPERKSAIPASELLSKPEIESFFKGTDEQIQFYSIRSLTFFHKAQIRISKGETDVKGDLEQALRDSEQVGLEDEDWANYIKATISYLDNDLDSLKEFAEKINLNKSLVQNFVKGIEGRGHPDYLADYSKEREPDQI